MMNSMNNNGIYLPRMDTDSCPNVLVAYGEGLSEKAGKLVSLLEREEINVKVSDIADVSAAPAFGGLHMAILRDGGISAPAFGMIERLRRSADIPIMTVSDDCGEIYRTMALAKGADICMSAEDFGSFEFKARVVSMLRRYFININDCGAAPSAPAARGSAVYGCGTAVYGCGPTAAETMINGSISVNRRRREVFRSGQLIRLTAIEYGIVEYLMENCGDVCPVDDIYRRVWNENPYAVRKTVVEHIRRIRSKIEPDPHNPSYIKVVFGIGYKMEKAV